MAKHGVSFPAPIAAYSLAEGSGTTSADNSGNSHTLTLNTTSWTTGHTGNGLTNTAVSIGASSAFTAPTGAITLMAWIKPLDLAASTTKFALGFVDSGGNTDVCIFTQRADFGTPNVLQADIRIGSLTALHGPALTVGTWTHVAITYNGSSVVLYKDGAVATSASTTGAISPGDAFYIAGWNTAAYDTDVVVDDVRVFNNALTQAQVVSAMATPV